MSPLHALANGILLTSNGLITGHAVLIRDGIIKSVVREDEIPSDAGIIEDLGGATLLPGFVDVQVNGGGGILFNDQPTVAGIRSIGRARRQYGTTGFLPTLISDDLPIIAAGLAAVDAAIEEHVPGVLGIHVEGPFLNRTKKGIHDVRKIQKLDREAIELLTLPRLGIVHVTLAPETTIIKAIKQLTSAGVIVSIGHSAASYEQATAALDAGVRGFTHLFNAMSPLTSREPGSVGAALDNTDCWCSLIVDGHHLHPASMRIALSCKSFERFMLVTDAMPCVGADVETFSLGPLRITLKDGMCLGPDGTLAGSNLNMAEAVRNIMNIADLSLSQAVGMASRSPAEFLGLGKAYGQIHDGQHANFELVDENLRVLRTWIEGVS